MFATNRKLVKSDTGKLGSAQIQGSYNGKSAHEKDHDGWDELKVLEGMENYTVQEEEKWYLHPHGHIRQRWDIVSILLIFYGSIQM
jgi:hypothetical protein